MERRFKGKVVVVTGGCRGIGKATAEAFVQEGARVAVVDVDSRLGEETVKKLCRWGEAIFVKADVSSPVEVRAMVDRVVREWGRIDILVNNAAIYHQGDVLETSEEQWARVMSIDLTGVFLCTKYVVPVMIQSGGGVIVNVSSEAGLVGIKGQVAYNTAKAGVIGFTRSCAVDLANKGIRVNVVCPGTTDTPLVREALSRSPNPEEARRRLEECRPLGRLGRPEEIAQAILFLASPDVGYATGAILSVDGGYTAQ